MSNARWLGTVSGQVAMDPDLSVTAKAVYLVLAVHADMTGWSYPSVSRIAIALDKSRRVVFRALAELEEAGVVERQHRFIDGRQTSNQYVLTDVRTIREEQ